jgi:uncharacterized membrane protein
MDRPITLILLTLLAVAELIADKLPNTPARTAPLGLIARIVLGCLCDALRGLDPYFASVGVATKEWDPKLRTQSVRLAT